jgi:hypothetical protein
MLKLKEWLEKDKDPEEIIQDLAKTYTKSIPKQLEIMLELLEYNPAWNFDPANLDPCKQKIQKLDYCIRKTLRSISSGTHNIDLLPIENLISSIVFHKWDVTHPLIPSDYQSIKAAILESVCRFTKELLNVIGLSCIHPKILKIVKSISNACELTISCNSMLRVYLEAIGNSGTDLVIEYFNKFKLIEKTIEHLALITCEESVTLGICKKNKKKKPGNGHQTRHRKVVMKKTETKKLKMMTEDTTQKLESKLIISNIKLITQAITCSPLPSLDLDAIFTIQIIKLPLEIQFQLLQLMVYYALSARKWIKKVRYTLEYFLKNLDFRNTCRHYLFLLDNFRY